jgi:hypothetical protein
MNDKKQIEEITKVIEEAFLDDYNLGCDPCANTVAEKLYNAGYRKQSEGEWLGLWDFECSVCHEYSEYKTNCCPNCGAKMKGV